MPNVAEYKKGMNTFIDSLNAAKRAQEAKDAVKYSDAYRAATIRSMESKVKNQAAANVFLAIYRNAVPVEDSLKTIYVDDINRKMLEYIEEAGHDTVYSFLEDASKRGSKPAKQICESANEAAVNFCMKYYTEEDIDIDDIEDKIEDITPDSEEIISIAEKVKSNMNLDQVSEMIENNVKATIANEIRIAKEEEEKLSEIESSLEKDDTVVEEADIESALIRAGYDPNSPYKPSLFNAIMIGETNKIVNEDCSIEDKQKKAFYESTKELTVLQTLQTLGIINITPGNVDALAYKYTSNN